MTREINLLKKCHKQESNKNCASGLILPNNTLRPRDLQCEFEIRSRQVFRRFIPDRPSGEKVGDSCSRDLQNSTWDRFQHLDSFHIKWKLTSEQLCFLSLLTDAMRQCSCVDISVGKHFPDSVELQRQVLASAPSLQEIDLRLSALFWQIPDYTFTLYSIIV